MRVHRRNGRTIKVGRFSTVNVSACDTASTSKCSAAEQKRLDGSLACIEKVPACVTGNEKATVDACFAHLSAECDAAFE